MGSRHGVHNGDGRRDDLWPPSLTTPIIQHTEGLTRDVLEELWSVNGKRIGLTRGEYLDVDHGSVEGLVRYIGKNKAVRPVLEAEPGAGEAEDTAAQ